MMRRMALLGLTVTALVACQKHDTPAAEIDRNPAEQATATDSPHREVIDVPETGLAPITDVDSCLALFGAAARRTGGDTATRAKTLLAVAVYPKAFKGLDDEFSRRDKVAELAPQVDRLLAPVADARFFTMTIGPEASRRLEIAQPFDDAGPGFRDGSGYLAGGESPPETFGGVEVGGTGGRESSQIEYRRSDSSGMRTCSLVFDFREDWHHWFIVPEEAQARAVEKARVANTLRLRFDGWIKGAKVESNDAIDYQAPFLLTEVARVHLVDDHGNILATPRAQAPAKAGN